MIKSIISYFRTYSGKIYWCLKKRFSLRLILCDVCPARIPKGTIFSHPIGIVIQRNTKIGKNCSIHQNVTIGQRCPGDLPATIGNNVIIYAHSIILGNVTIGNNTVIGAGSIVIDSIPPDSVYVCEIAPKIRKKESGELL